MEKADQRWGRRDVLWNGGKFFNMSMAPTSTLRLLSGNTELSVSKS